MTGAEQPLRTRPWLALQTTVVVQLVASAALSTAAVLAPAVAPLLGLAPERVGIFVGLSYLCAMLTGLGSAPWVARLGATRVMQCVLLVLAVGAATAASGSAALVLLAGAALIGIGYGTVNPAAAAVLGRHAPPGSPGLFFAVKQAAVPLGIATAAALMPLGLVALGWRATGWVLAGVCVLLALLLVPVARRLDPPADPDARPDVAWLELLRRVLREPELRSLSLVSLAYAMAQQGFLTFSVLLLTLKLGVPLAVAAGLLAASQVVCTVARIALGHVADRWIAPGILLGALGLAMSASCLALALLPVGAPLAWIALAMAACGATTMGWNGVFFAQLVRSVPREQLAGAAGGTQFFTFAGAMAGPVIFGQLVHVGASYATGYACLAVLSACAGLAVLRSARAGRPAVARA
jgi:predicted MFS family arabinose efflux permease